MAPTIVLKNGEPFLVLGSAGSSRIPGIVSHVISSVIDQGVDPAEAVSLPRVIWGGNDFFPSVLVEIIPPITPADMSELEARGFEDGYTIELPAQMRAFVPMGAVNLVAFNRDTRDLVGVSDSRRGGSAGGARF